MVPPVGGAGPPGPNKKADVKTPFPKYAAGTKLWMPCADLMWKKADVIKSEDWVLTVRDLSDDQDIDLGPETQVYLRNEDMMDEEGLIGLEDLTQLNHLHEAEVLNSLNIRFDVDKIYTFTGAILIAVNPFKRIAGIYDDETLKHFLVQKWNRAFGGERTPHVFDTANQAFRGLCGEGTSQTILISGESGAGKTESTKLVMKLLAMAGSTDWTNRSLIENQVLQSNPLLEAFGNAKTLRNDNSSRFGKFIEMQFMLDNAGEGDERVGRLAGARIHTYLLESVRVCRQLEGERNYHAFYQLAAAASRGTDKETGKYTLTPDMAAALGIKLNEAIEYDFSSFGACDQYRYLTRSSCMTLQSVDDLDEFAVTALAMHTIGISIEEQRGVWALVGAILHLGNLSFEAPGGQSESSAISKMSAKEMETCSKLLGVPVAKLEEMLCVRYIRTRNESFKKPLTLSESEDTRDALARALYGTMFLKIVERTNQSIGYRDDVKLFCGVLDIFGFECFQTNSFEQICINFTNERLQHFFNTFVFKCEQELYERENIPWDPLDFPDNQDCVELLQMKLTGVFPMLDEECVVPKGSDKGFCSKLRETHKDHIRFGVIKTRAMWFTINHFAGPVNYCSEGFLEKNRDQLFPDVAQGIKDSPIQFVSDCFTRYLVRDQDAANAAHASQPDLQKVASKKKQVTVSSEFRQQLNSLMGTVEVTAPHFIRCIKPNSQNKPDIFERKNVTEQLRNNGVLQAVQVSRAGYPVRSPHADFYLDYRSLLAKADREKAEKLPPGRGQAQLCLDILNEKLAIPKPKHSITAWAVGVNQVFLKHEAFERLSDARAVQRNQAAITIQSACRMWLQKKLYRQIIASVVKMQAAGRMYLAKKRVKKMFADRLAEKLQAARLRYKARCYYVSLQELACTLSCLWKARYMRMELTRIREMVCAMKIRAGYLGFVERKEAKRRDAAAVKIQTMLRAKKARKVRKNLAEEAKKLDNVQAKLAEAQAKARAAEEARQEELAAMKREAEARKLADEEEKKQVAEKATGLEQQLADKIAECEALQAENAALKSSLEAATREGSNLNVVASRMVDKVGELKDMHIESVETRVPSTEASPVTARDVNVSRQLFSAEMTSSGPTETTTATATGASNESGSGGGVPAFPIQTLPSQQPITADRRLDSETGTAAEPMILTAAVSNVGLSEPSANLAAAPALPQPDVLSQLEMDHAKLKQNFHLLQGQLALLPLPLPEELLSNNSNALSSSLSSVQRDGSKSSRDTSGRKLGVGAAAHPVVDPRLADIILACSLSRSGAQLAEALLCFASGDDERKLAQLAKSAIGDDNSQTAFDGPISLFLNVPAVKQTLTKIVDLTSAGLSRLNTGKGGSRSGGAQRDGDGDKSQNKALIGAALGTEGSNGGNIASYPLTISVWDTDKISRLSEVEVGAVFDDIAKLSRNAFHVGTFLPDSPTTDSEVPDQETETAAGGVVEELMYRVAPHCGKFEVNASREGDKENAGKVPPFPASISGPLCRLELSEFSRFLSLLTSDCSLRRAEMIGFFQEAAKAGNALWLPTNAAGGQTTRNLTDAGKPSFLQNLKNLLPGLPTSATPVALNAPSAQFGIGPSHTSAGAAGPNISKLGTMPRAMSARALADRFLRPSFVSESNAELPEMARKIQISAVYKEEHNRGPITCVKFGKEHKQKAFYLLAVAFKSGRIFIYKIGRLKREVEMFEEQERNMGQLANTTPGLVSEPSVPLSTDGEGGAKEQETAGSPVEEITPLRALEGHSRAVTSLFFTHDDEQVVSTSIDCTVKFWEVRRGYLLKVFTDAVPILVAAFLPSSSDVFLTSNTSAVIRLVHSTSGRILQKFKSDNEIRAVCFDHIGTHCIAGLKDGHLQIYEIDSTEKKFNYRKRFAISKNAITSVLFCPPTMNRSPFVVVNSCDNSITIVDVMYKLPAGDIGSVSIRQRCQIRHATIPLSAALICQSEEETFVASPSEDGSVMIFGCTSNSQISLLHDLKVHRAPVVTVESNAMCSLLISADTHGDVVFWRRQVPPAGGGFAQGSLSNIRS